MYWTWLRSLFITGACCVAWAPAPSAWAQSEPSSCTLRTSIDIYSKPKTQGRRIRLSAGTMLQVLGHSGNWYTVYTGTAEAYVLASAYLRACGTARNAPRPKPAPELIDLPLEPLPPAPVPPSNPATILPKVQDLKEAPGASAATPPTPPQAAPEATRPAPRRLETPSPSSYFEPRPALELHVAPQDPWWDVELGLWIGGGVTALASVVLGTTNVFYAETAKKDIHAYDPNAADASTKYPQVNHEANVVKTLNVLTVVTGVVGGAALAAALGLHFWAPKSSDASESNPMAMMPRFRLRPGWRSLVLEGEF